MNVERFIASKITNSKNTEGKISKPIVKIGVIGVVIGVSVMILTVSIVLGFKKEITNKITGLTTHIAVSNVNINPSNEPEPVSLNQDTIQLLKKLPFVTCIQGTTLKNGILKTNAQNEGVVLKGVDENYDFSFIKKSIIEGDIPDYTDTLVKKDVLISKTLANKLDIKLNQKLIVYFIVQHVVYDSSANEEITKYEQRSRDFKVTGIYKSSFADFDDNLMIVDSRKIQTLNYWNTNQVAAYEIKVDNFDKLDIYTIHIQDFLGYNYSVNNVKVIYANIFVWLEKLDINGIIVIVLMILVATINMITALLILILERANMVGLVKALGMNNVSVRKIFIHISLKLIIKGMIIGNIVGICLCLLQRYHKLIKLDSAVYYVEHIAIDLNWTYILILNAGTFLICLLMLLLPTLILTKLTPIKTLKFD